MMLYACRLGQGVRKMLILYDLNERIINTLDNANLSLQ